MQEYIYSVMTGQARGIFAFVLRLILWPLSFIYGVSVSLLRFCCRAGICPRAKLDKPVISVGNITWGGVGKTPLVQRIAEFAKEKNLKPVILTRGYKTEEGAISDEVMDLKQSLGDVPVVVGENRVKGAREILKKYAADVFLLDDGFQQWRLKKDLDIVAVDATNPFGNGSLIPRGILREGLSSLRRADLFVITKSDIGHANITGIKKQLDKISTDTPVIETIHEAECFERINDGEVFDLFLIRGKSICAFCGIGNPKSFEKTLLSLGVNLKKNFRFRDHYEYTRKDIQKIVDYCRAQDIQYIVTTSKDAVKLSEYSDLFGDDLQCWVLKIQFQITHGKEEFFGRINHLLHR